jgi:thiamine biosynthesis lipoprotein
VVRAVRLPPGVELDLGGIGKGLAADLVVAELLHRGASGACVNLGGDLRVSGVPPTDDGWVLDVAYAPGVLIALADGAAATSSRLERRWRRAGRDLHHLIDPRSGMPANTGIAAITVLAGRAADAELLTKAAFLAGADEAPQLVASAGATGLLLLDDGALVALPGVERYLR